MIEKERHVLIMEQLRSDGFVSVKDLMGRLNASRSSIMRDLIALEEAGLLVREHGGAALPEVREMLSRKKEPAVLLREHVNADQKAIIAEAAAQLVKPGMCIFVDSGSTTASLIPYLRDLDITIVTASVYLLRQISDDMACRVYLTGGQYDAKYDMMMGEYAVQMLENYRFDLAFMSASAIDLKQGEVMVADFGLASMKKQAMKRSAKTVLLADSTKLSQAAPCTYASITAFDAVYINGSGKQKFPKNFITVEEKKR